MSFIPKPHEIYKHFKGNLYQITAIAEHTETGETLVVYQAMYGDFKTYARPLAMFVSPVDREKYPDAAQEFRFELQGPEAARQRAEAGIYSQPESVISDAAVPAEEPRLKTAPGQPQESAGQSVQGLLGQGVTGRPEQGQSQREHLVSAALSGQEPQRQGYADAAAQPQPGPAGDTEEINIDPLVLEFLDADSYEQRLNILAGLHHRITDDMITTMAIACDVEVGEGDIEERYESLKACLVTMERYECNRWRGSSPDRRSARSGRTGPSSE